MDQLERLRVLEGSTFDEAGAKPGTIHRWATGLFKKAASGEWLKVAKQGAASAASAAGGAVKDKAAGVAKSATSTAAAAKAFVTKAPGDVKKFFTDEGHRRSALMKAHEALTTAPKKFAQKAAEVAKHEVHEFKTAGSAVKSLVRGEKLSHEQKHALKTVVTHMAITIAASAAGATGVGAFAGGVAKGLARHFASKVAGSVFEKLHLVDELGHLKHFFHEASGDDDQGMAAVGELVAREVAAAMKDGISADDVASVAAFSSEEAKDREESMESTKLETLRKLSEQVLVDDKKDLVVHLVVVKNSLYFSVDDKGMSQGEIDDLLKKVRLRPSDRSARGFASRGQFSASDTEEFADEIRRELQNIATKKKAKLIIRDD